MITDEEFMKKIDDLTRDYQGDICHLYEAAGMILIGRLFGSRVMRLVTPRLTWTRALKLFGNFDQLMDEKGDYYNKSLGMKAVDAMGDYWEVIKRHKAMPVQEKRIIQ